MVIKNIKIAKGLPITITLLVLIAVAITSTLAILRSEERPRKSCF